MGAAHRMSAMRASRCPSSRSALRLRPPPPPAAMRASAVACFATSPASALCLCLSTSTSVRSAASAPASTGAAAAPLAAAAGAWPLLSESRRSLRPERALERGEGGEGGSRSKGDAARWSCASGPAAPLSERTASSAGAKRGVAAAGASSSAATRPSSADTCAHATHLMSSFRGSLCQPWPRVRRATRRACLCKVNSGDM
jgi:hypothetical protein